MARHDKVEMYLQDMSDQTLYKDTEELDRIGEAFMVRYGNRNSYQLDWKSPYIHIRILCKEILGERALK